MVPTNVSFSELLDWFHNQFGFKYLLLYVSDFGDGEQHLDKLIHDGFRYDRSTDRYICFTCFLDKKYFQNRTRFAYVKRGHVPGKNPDFDSRMPKGAAPLVDKITDGNIDISATVEACDEIRDHYGVLLNQLPAFVMIPRTGRRARIVYSLKSESDIKKFFDLLDVFTRYRKDYDTIYKTLRRVEAIQRELLQLDKNNSDISSKIPPAEASVREKEKVILQILGEYLQLPVDFHPSPQEITSLLKEQGKLEDFFMVKKLPKIEKRKLKKQGQLDKFLESEENQRVSSRQECFRTFREEFNMWDGLKRELDEIEKRKVELKLELQELAQCDEIQQALAHTAEETEKQLKERNSDFLTVLQRQCSVTEEQGQKILRELTSPEWISFESFDLLIGNLRKKDVFRGLSEDAMGRDSDGRKYDVFISYRRATGQMVALVLEQALEARGFKVFFDFNSIRDGQFNERIFAAIEEASVIVLIMSESALDLCVQKDDWVRAELEHALKFGKKIVPVAPLGQKKSFPDNLPESLKNLRETQISDIDMGSLFKPSIDQLIRDRFPADIRTGR